MSVNRQHYTFQQGHRGEDYARSFKFIRKLFNRTNTTGIRLSNSMVREYAREVYGNDYENIDRQRQTTQHNHIRYMFQDCKNYTKMMKQDPNGDGLYYPQYDEINKWMSNVGIHASESIGLGLGLLGLKRVA